MKRFPWITLALVALAAAASLVPAEALEYDRARVAAGEVWRLLSGQMVHWTARMAACDLGVLLGLGIWLEVRGDRRLMAMALALGGGLTALAVHALSPDLLVYRGSSGVASALFVLAAVRIAESPEPWPRALAVTAVAFFLAKAAFETLVGQTLFAGPLPLGVRVVPLVHLLGGIGGLAGVGGRLLNRTSYGRVLSRREANASAQTARDHSRESPSSGRVPRFGAHRPGRADRPRFARL